MDFHCQFSGDDVIDIGQLQATTETYHNTIYLLKRMVVLYVLTSHLHSPLSSMLSLDILIAQPLLGNIWFKNIPIYSGT